MQRFPLESSQLELLLAFAKSGGLSQLAKLMARDPSVVSRQLKRLEETARVIVKQNGRWVLSPLGSEIIEMTEKYLIELDRALRPTSRIRLPENTALLLINTQKIMSSPELGPRSSPEAENSLMQILSFWRLKNRPLVHIKHVSSNPESPWYSKADTCQFLESFRPLEGEKVLEKTRSSAFSASQLENVLTQYNSESLLLTGYTASDCIAATAIQAENLGYQCHVVKDATVTFQIKGPDQKTYQASEVHELIMASLHQSSSKILSTIEVLDS